MNTEKTSDLYSFRSTFAQTLAAVGFSIYSANIGLIFGMPTIVIGELRGKDSPLGMSESQASWFGSLYFITQPLGSLVSGMLQDWLGRKRTLMMINVPQLTAWVMLYFATSTAHLFVSTALMGLTIGFLEAPILSYVGEISQPRLRGVFSSFLGIFYNSGLMVEGLLGAAFPWRTMVLCNMVGPVIGLLAMAVLPDSPAWLVTKGRVKDAERACQWLRGWVSPDKVRTELDTLVCYVRHFTMSCCLQLPDSPAWLVTKGRVRDAERAYQWLRGWVSPDKVRAELDTLVCYVRHFTMSCCLQLPDSPAWLVTKGRVRDAERAYQWLRGWVSPDKVRAELDTLVCYVRHFTMSCCLQLPDSPAWLVTKGRVRDAERAYQWLRGWVSPDKVRAELDTLVCYVRHFTMSCCLQLPDSPAWLVTKGRVRDAERAYQWLRGWVSPDKVRAELDTLVCYVRHFTMSCCLQLPDSPAWLVTKGRVRDAERAYQWLRGWVSPDKVRAELDTLVCYVRDFTMSCCLQLPDSPAWLVTKGRVRDAERAYQWLRGWVSPDKVRAELDTLVCYVRHFTMSCCLQLPDSPAWLVTKGRVRDAERAYQWLRGWVSPDKVRAELDTLVCYVRHFTMSCCLQLPDSPAWLVTKGRVRDAERAYQWLRGWVSPDKVRAELNTLVCYVRHFTMSCCLQLPDSPAWLVTKGRVRDAERAYQWLRGWAPDKVRAELDTLVCYVRHFTMSCCLQLPDSPAWLVTKGRVRDAERAYQWLRGWVSPDKVRAELDTLVCYVRDTQQSEYKLVASGEGTPTAEVLPGKTKSSWQVLLEPDVLKAFQIILIFFTVTPASMISMRPFFIEILNDLDLPLKSHTIVAVCGVLTLLGAVMMGVSFKFLGKRKVTFLAMGTSVLCCFGLGGYLMSGIFLPWIPLLLFCTSYFFGAIVVTIPWIFLVELFPLRARSTGSSVCAAFAYVMFFAVTKTYYNLVSWLAVSGTCLLYGVVGLLGTVYLYLELPETEGHALADIERRLSERRSSRKKMSVKNGSGTTKDEVKIDV